jgi:hypothetical protein
MDELLLTATLALAFVSARPPQPTTNVASVATAIKAVNVFLFINFSALHSTFDLRS